MLSAQHELWPLLNEITVMPLGLQWATIFYDVGVTNWKKYKPKLFSKETY